MSFHGAFTKVLRPSRISRTPRRILVISYGAFSGIRDSMIRSLERCGCDVIHTEHSLRFLPLRPFYAALIVIAAIVTYQTRFRSHLDHTSIAQWVHRRANQAIVRKADRVEAVISLKLTANPCPNDDLPSAVVTDHMNLLSKRAPNFGLELPERATNPSWNTWEQIALVSQDYLFPLSHYVGESMIHDYGIDPRKVVAIGAGANLDVDAGRDAITKDSSKQNILFVGLEADRKGLPDLLSAFRSFSKVYPGARLDIVGVVGIGGHGIHYHGQLTGEPLKRLFYEAHVMVMPTLREPFGIVFLEAMWARAVCIGTNRFAIPEFIDDGVTGYLVEPRMPEEIASRLLALFSDPSKLANMAELAYQRARKNWSWDIAASKLLNAMFDDTFTYPITTTEEMNANTLT